MDRHFVVRLRGERRPSKDPSPAGAGDSPLVLGPATWGLVAPPREGERSARLLINARSESAARLPSFRGAFAKRRCVVPVDGFYEWVGPKQARRPIWFHPTGDGVLHLAGLWEPGAPAPGAQELAGEPLPTFTILTTRANDLVAPVHDRMPVVLAANEVEAWLRGSSAEAGALLRPCPTAVLAAREVSARANRVENDDPACLEPWVPMDPGAAPEAAAPAKRGRNSERRNSENRGSSRDPTLLLFAEETLRPASAPAVPSKVGGAKPG